MFGCPRSTLGHCRGSCLNNTILLTEFDIYFFSAEGHMEPRNEVRLKPCQAPGGVLSFKFSL